MALETKIESLKIQGFRSLADVELKDIPDAAVLIGPNGSGKSNVFLFLEMLRQMLRYRRLGQFVEQHGGADDQLFEGSARTPTMNGRVQVRTDEDLYRYQFFLSFAHPERLFLSGEYFESRGIDDQITVVNEVSGFGQESEFAQLIPDEDSTELQKSLRPVASELVDIVGGWAFHHFHNTDFNSNIKKSCDITDNVRLRADGGNLAAILYRLEREDTRRYDYICNLVNRILPTFDRFDLEESYGKVLLRWKAQGSDKTMGAHLTSDGSLRYFCLVTLLNLPEQMMPSIILLDEPELGLHPSAISLIGAMIKRMSRHRQVIVATQSPLLVDEFDLDEIYVFDLEEGQTQVSRPDEEGLKHWLEEYSTGELWQKNVLGGRP